MFDAAVPITGSRLFYSEGCVVPIGIPDPNRKGNILMIISGWFNFAITAALFLALASIVYYYYIRPKKKEDIEQEEQPKYRMLEDDDDEKPH